MDDLTAKDVECQEAVNDYKSLESESMIRQTRTVELLCKTHKGFIELLKRLKVFDEEVDTINNDNLQKKVNDVKAFIDSLNDDRTQQFDDIVKKVKNLGKKLADDLDDDAVNLEETGEKLKSSPLSDADKVGL